MEFPGQRWIRGRSNCYE